MENYKIWLGDLNNEDSRDMLTQYFSEELGKLWDEKLFKEWHSHSGRLKHKKIFFDYDERVDGDENEDWNRYILINEIDIIRFGGLEDLGVKEEDWLLVDNVLYLNTDTDLIEDVFDFRLKKSKTEKFEWCVLLKNN
jgi:hypothetical protein